MKGGIYRPPANFSILVHNLKHGGFRFTHARMQRHLPYDDAACRRDTLRQAHRNRQQGGKRAGHAVVSSGKRGGAGGAFKRKRRRAAGPVAADS